MIKPVIIWDWNGTLLDDVDICVKAMNKLLEARRLSVMSKVKYRDIFRFPVQEYYHELGFNFEKEDFAIPALEFMRHYQDLLPEAVLFGGVLETLEKLKAAGYRQFVLSAMEQNLLNQLLKKHRISTYFEYIQGIEDHFASGKMMAAQKLIALIGQYDIKPLLVGDTLHDAEVGEAAGFKTVLFSGGHFSENRLKQAKLPLFENHKDLQKFLLKKSQDSNDATKSHR